MNQSGTTWGLLVALLATTACSRSGTPASVTVDEYVVDCTVAEDAGIPGASDENLAAFVNAEAAGLVVSDACRSPALGAPSSGSLLSPGVAPAISFSLEAATCSGLEPMRTRWACAAQQPSGFRRTLEALGALVERRAEAHCGAFSGENYYFRLRHAGEAKPVYSALLSVTSYTPDPAIWSRALADRAGQTLTATIERAVFLQGDITEGPYVQPSPPTFTVAP